MYAQYVSATIPRFESHIQSQLYKLYGLMAEYNNS